MSPAEQDRVAEQSATDLPERDALSVAHPNLADLVNTATAINFGSDNATQIANQTQEAPIVQQP
jgi:hypothetical protein